MSVDKPKAGKGRILGWVVTGLVILVFVGARQIHPNGLFGLIGDLFTEASTSAAVKEPRDRMLEALVPLGAAAICLKEYGESAELRSAVESHLRRNKEEVQKLTTRVEDAGGMSRAEKDLLDREGYQAAVRFVGQGSAAETTCAGLADRFNAGEFDL